MPQWNIYVTVRREALMLHSNFNLLFIYFSFHYKGKGSNFLLTKQRINFDISHIRHGKVIIFNWVNKTQFVEPGKFTIDYVSFFFRVAGSSVCNEEDRGAPLL